MASKDHQLILGLVTRKMREKGYEIICFDGNEKIISDISLRAPFTIRKHKPDAIGVNIVNKKICIGEAKTSSDLDSKRTKDQFSDYSNLFAMDSKKPCEIIIGIPRSSENKLIRLLDSLGINNNPNVSYVWMPDEFLSKNEEHSI